ncbi:MAG: THUMP domain-containing protein [Flavobacteriales bacterium]|jgi:putative N6-adenine-specific DNA methylase|nr:THUMP domain-containing protein [Flavobacteriales bacterium]
MKIVARTLAGLEEVLAEEIKQIGGKEIEIFNRAVEYKGDVRLLYKSNLWLRTAIDVLLPLSKFQANNEEELYEKVQKINWSNYITSEKTFSINPIVHSSIFTHSHYASLKVKDAIVDQLREKKGRRPNIDTENPDVKIMLRISENKCSLLLNSSGEPLFKRGYRTYGGVAPINEVLAAGIIGISEWDTQTPFIDPMCGSGTFAIEAAMKAKNIAPGYIREAFGFMNWLDYREDIWEGLKYEAQFEIKDQKAPIYAFDKSRQTIRTAEMNANSIEALNNAIQFEMKDFFKNEKPTEEGIIVTNPPYEVRLKTNNIEQFYELIGNNLKHKWTGYDAWIISSNLNAIKRLGLKPKKKVSLLNAQLESKLVHLPLYAGSKKIKQE